EDAFHIDEDVRAVYRAMAERGQQAHATWRAGLAKWREAHPDKSALFDAIFSTPPADLAQKLVAAAGTAEAATRALGGKVVNEAAKLLPSLVGGSADLDESTATFLKGEGVSRPGEYGGRNIHFGIREHAMAAVVNGLTL